jgi:mRNA interferase MazF
MLWDLVEGYRAPPTKSVTTSVARLYPSEAYVRVNGEQRKAMADQLSTISKRHLRQRAGSRSPADVAAMERASCLQLGL